MEETRNTIGTRKDPEEIRADIEQTRAELEETVSVLKEKLSFQHLKDQLKEDIQNATIGRAKKMMNVTSEKAKEWSSTASETLKQNIVTRTIINNPIPAALAGIGLGWLILRGPGRTNGYEDYEETWEPGSSEAGKREQMMSQAREKAGEVAGQAREKAGQIAEQAREKAGQISAATRQKAQVYKERYLDVLQNRPMALVAAAFALGLVVGFSVPETRREHELMGESKEKLLSRAKEMAEETFQKAERVVEEVQSSS